MLLIIQTRIVGRQSAGGKTAEYSGRSLFYLVLSLLCITVLAVSVSWVTPQLRVPSIQNAIAAGLPWKQDLQESGFNILNAVPAKKSVSTISGLQELNFGRYWHMGDDIKFTVYSSRPAYWQMNVYDTYDSGGWVSGTSGELLMEKKTGWEDAENVPGREKLVYRVTTGIDTDTVLLTGDFVSSEMPVLVRTGVDGEVTAVRAPRLLSAGESYTVRSYVSDPAADDLFSAGDDYPDSITAVYLQLPPGLSGDIKILSENVTRDAGSPYEMVLAVAGYLSSNMTYSLEVGELPEGADAVEEFLFTQKSGFCLHFASAMAVMLRSVGVPARLAVGYLPGEPGEEKGEYLLRDRNYHAWPQVYFPGYGWINFEATPGSVDTRASGDSPLVSVPGIRSSPSWDVWFLPPGMVPPLPDDGPPATPEARPVTTGGKLSYADELALILMIVFGILSVLALLFGLKRIVRSFVYRRLWSIDREHLAASAYSNLCQLAAILRVSPEPQQTPLEFSSRLASVIPEQSKELDYIVRAHLVKRFGPDKGKCGLYEEAEILKARVSVYDALLRRMGIVQKLLGRGDRG